LLMSPVGPLLAFALTATLIVLLRPLAIAVGLVDIPSGRKNHSGSIPLIGGIAIFVAALIASVSLYFFETGMHASSSASLVAFFTAGFLLVVVGAWDDYQDLPAIARFLAQISASLIMIFSGGVVLTDLGALSLSGGLLSLGWIGIPFTVFACLGIINAMNMCDGLDGLSGGIALIALLGLGIANSLGGSVGNQHLIVVFTACVAGFLVFNLRTLWRSKAWVFLGDAGSMLLGLALVWISISLSQGEARVISPAVALWFLMLPIYDAVSMMLRRLLRRRSPFRADREHLHHIFLMAGFSVAETVTLMCGIAVAGVVVGLFGMLLNVPDIWLASAFTVGGLLHYWTISRAWRVMRFLQRSICRRTDKERRTDEQQPDDTFQGKERRAGVDRRDVA
jgi:UDP-GlcNAc:undecaprenyl-phosphate GlcNAc-1-phosphate transferase